MAEVTPAPRRAAPLMKLGLLAVFLVAVFLVAARTPLGAYLTRDGVFQLIDWLRAHPWAPVVFVALYAGATAMAVPGTILTFAGGAVFGFWWGTILNMLAANLGASAAFLLARSLGRDGVRSLIGNDSRALEKLDDVVTRHGFRGLLTLRLIPLVPFNALNFGSGLMPLGWGTYATATLIGIVPGTAIYTFFADALLEGSREAGTQALVRVLIAGALLVFLSFLPALLRPILKRRGIRLPGMGAILLAAALPAAAAAQQQPHRAAGLPDHSGLTAVLTSVVTDSGVDYARLAADPSGLDRYISELHATDLSALSAAAPLAERLAFWINAYNACMLKRVVSHYPIRPARGLLRIRNAAARRPANSVWQIEDVFTGPHCPVAGAERSQDEIEHEIIRPLGDPRIHFAINCAAVSCPPLTREAYRAETLDEQLDARVDAFVGDPVQFAVDPSGRRPTVRLNVLLDWFNEDFGGHDGVRAFLARYTGGDAREALEDPNVRLVFSDYDWTLNDIAR